MNRLIESFQESSSGETLTEYVKSIAKVRGFKSAPEFLRSVDLNPSAILNLSNGSWGIPDEVKLADIARKLGVSLGELKKRLPVRAPNANPGELEFLDKLVMTSDAHSKEKKGSGGLARPGASKTGWRRSVQKNSTSSLEEAWQVAFDDPFA